MINNTKKNFFWNVIGSTLNSTTSLFFLIIVTRINGIDKAGIFTFAFSTACLFQVIGVYSGRTYQVTETDDNLKNNDFINNRIISCLLMLIVSLAFVFIKGYNTYKILVILVLVLFKMIEAFSETIYSIIQKNNDLYKVGKSLLFKGFLGLFLFLIINLLTHNMLVSSISLIIVNLFILIFYDLKNLKKYNYERTKLNILNIKKIFISGFYTFVFTILTQYVINAPKYSIDNLLSDKYQTIFGIIVMPATLILLFCQFLIHPFLVSMTDKLKENKIKQFKNMVYKLVISVFIFGIISNIFIYFLGIPFLELIYGVNLDDYLNSLIIIIFGATLFGMSYMLLTALTTMRKTFVQVLIFLVASLFALLISSYLVKTKLVYGASLSYFLSMLLLFIEYIIVFNIVIKKRGKINENINNNTSI